MFSPYKFKTVHFLIHNITKFQIIQDVLIRSPVIEPIANEPLVFLSKNYEDDFSGTIISGTESKDSDFNIELYSENTNSSSSRYNDINYVENLEIEGTDHNISENNNYSRNKVISISEQIKVIISIFLVVN